VWDRPDDIAASPADRAREALLDDPARSNREIALAARSTPQIVTRARKQLADLGLIPPGPHPQRRFPAHKALPRPPAALMQGACVGHPRPEAWTDPRSPADRILAAVTCAGCHLLLPCREWSLHLPGDDLAIYGGWGASDRERERIRRSGGPLPARLTTAGKNAARDRRAATARQQQEQQQQQEARPA
jgi:hypothetical protein